MYGSNEDFDVANVSLDNAIIIQPVMRKTPPVKMQNATLHRTVKQTSLIIDILILIAFEYFKSLFQTVISQNMVGDVTFCLDIL